MKRLFKIAIWPIFFILVITNIYIFVSGITLGDEINTFETESKKIHLENMVLENKKSHLGSISYAASIAAELNFSKKQEPIYLDNAKYAMNR